MSWNVGFEEHWSIPRTQVVLETLLNSNTTNIVSTSTYAAGAIDLRKSVIDVVCLTEVWGQPSVIPNYMAASANIFPYSLSVLDYSGVSNVKDSFQPPCLDYYSENVAAAKIVDFSTCFLDCFVDNVENMDTTLSSADTCSVQCLLSTFEDVLKYDKNVDACWSCLMETMYNVYQYYTSPTSSRESLLDFTTGTLTQCYLGKTNYSWNQTLGLLVLSKIPINLVEKGYYQTFIVPRGYILFEVPSWNNTLIACTHLTPINDASSYQQGYSTPYSSWAEENTGSAQHIIDVMTTAYAGYENQIITGDLNHSPELYFPLGSDKLVTGAIGEEGYYLLSNWSTWSTEGTADASSVGNLYIETNYKFSLTDESGQSKLCTACNGTATSGNNVCPTNPQRLYDFIWTKGEYWTSGRQQLSYRILDQTVQITVNNQCYNSKLSDHYPIVLVTSPVTSSLASPSQFNPRIFNVVDNTTSWCTASSSSSSTTTSISGGIGIVIIFVTICLSILIIDL